MAEEKNTTQRLNKACALIIVVAGMERFAFKGVASNLVTYLTDVLGMSNSSSAMMINTWRGYTFMLPLLVTTLTDSYWDRYSTILASSFLYVLGLSALTITTTLRSHENTSKASSLSYLFWSLYLISTGQGGYNSSLQALGAERAEKENEYSSSEDDKNSNKKTLFFQWSYFGNCSGTLLGNMIMPYIQDTLGWSLGFGIPTIDMVISVAIFSCGNRIFGYNENNVVFLAPFKKMVHAIKGHVSKMRNDSQFALASTREMVELELQEEPLCHKDIEKSQPLECSGKPGLHLVEIAKVIYHLLPIWTTLLMFAVTFEQPPTFFTKQGMAMTRNIGPNFKVPPATLQAATTISIVLLIPFYDKMFIPMIRLITRNDKGITVMQRMGIGMFLSVIAMAVSAFVEAKSTLSSDLGGAPFGNVVSFSDGLPNKGRGIPYFYLTTVDPTARDALKDPRASLTISEFPIGTCGKIDPENPTCAKLTLNGKLKLVDENTTEAKFARNSLFTKHPEMKGWPKGHNFQIFKLEIENIFMINMFGGPKPLTVAQYLQAKT